MDRKINKPTPYFGFYVSQDHQTKGRDHEPIYQHPAEIRGSAQVIPRSKYQNDGVAILNFRLKSFNCDTGDLGKILEPFAAAFFPNQGGHSLLFENIDFDLTRGHREHRQIIERVQENLRAATPTLKTVIVLITTHAEDNTGELGTSSTNHANINDWMTQVITRPILDMIHALNTHWFFLCCGALVNVPTSLDGVRSFAKEWKPANLFAFDAPAFHPIYAATFLLNFFQHIVIEGRSFDSAVGLLLNTSALSRHTGIKRFWSRGEVRIGLFATIVPKNAFTIFPINAHKAETDHKKLIVSSEFIATEIGDVNAAAEGRGVAELITRFEGRKYSLRCDDVFYIPTHGRKTVNYMSALTENPSNQILRVLSPIREWRLKTLPTLQASASVPTPEETRPGMAPPRRRGRGANRRPTALEALAARIPSDGPRVDVTAVAPWEIPIWAARLSHMGVMSPHRRKAWTKDLTRSLEGMNIAVVHVVAALTNEGREDDKAVGGAAAVMNLGTRWGEPAESWDWTHGKMAKQFDVACFGLAKTVEALTIRFAAEATPPDTIFVLCSDASALLAVKNTRNKTAQSSALLFHFSLTTLCTIHRNTNIVLVWTPTDHELENQTVARHKATGACRRDPPGGVGRVQSAAYQKDRARQKAFQEWAAEWKKRQGEIRAGQRTASFADKVTLTKPPDGNNHPLWSAATECERDAKGKKTKKALFSRRTTSTAFQIAVDHAFTGSYATRFRPADPPESLRCPCGEPLRSSPHALYHCQRYYFERHAFGVVRYGRTIPYNKLPSSHKKNALRFLTFLQETRALSRPETGSAYVPPEPD
ncbi:hypothetical protein EDB85DRAFT_2215399 [Lactarius pseudohatsudake]|nr:hypothetical protein EDB85DRAFT_2215399 [Lactarius pseudohatsudake]